MQQNEKRLITDSVFWPILQTIHNIASTLAGWWVFHYQVYPLTCFAKGVTLMTQLPIYVLNVLAFGCTAYVLTRPMLLLLVEFMGAFERAVCRLLSRL